MLNTYSEQQLADIFYLYGELRNARRIASAVVKERNHSPLTTTGQLVELATRLLPRDREKKETAKLFQALRIEVNHEMEALKDLLNSATALLAPSGRLVVIKTGDVNGHVEQDFYGRTLSPLTPVNNKVIVPDQEEQQRNPRSRSAKLRIAEKR